MKKQRMKRAGSLILAVLTALTCFSGTAWAKEYDVKPSNENYIVELNESYNFFICNKKSIGTEPGTEYYMTYTVKSSNLAAEPKYCQQGVIGCIDPEKNYPYEADEDGNGGGTMYYDTNSGNRMLVAGRTYFLKFVITEEGYNYTAAWGKDDGVSKVSRYIKYNTIYKGKEQGLEYFGLWNASDNVTATLEKVRCYDKNGNDLGVQIFDQGNTAVSGTETGHTANKAVDHWYTVTGTPFIYGAISNKLQPSGNTIYMEYTVKKGDLRCRMEGVILSGNPLMRYPYDAEADGVYEGHLIYNQYNENNYDDVQESILFKEGASYFLTFEKRKTRLMLTVQRTYQGKVEYITFNKALGEYSIEHPNAFVWLEDGDGDLILENFRCYDVKNNDLGLQCNNESVTFAHHGALEDYSGCEAIYRCKEDASFYALYSDRTLKFTEGETTTNGTYSISQNVMTMNVEGKKSTIDYLYQSFTTPDGRLYERLYTYKVRFDSNGGSAVETQVLNAENGFKPMCPLDPTLDGNTFLGWYTSDDEQYEFGGICLESMTLYAKWEKTEYKELVKDVLTADKPAVWLYITVGAVILAGMIAAGVVILANSKKKGNKHE